MSEPLDVNKPPAGERSGTGTESILQFLSEALASKPHVPVHPQEVEDDFGFSPSELLYHTLGDADGSVTAWATAQASLERLEAKLIDTVRSAELGGPVPLDLEWEVQLMRSTVAKLLKAAKAAKQRP
jgi:hypothetical protein